MIDRTKNLQLPIDVLKGSRGAENAQAFRGTMTYLLSEEGYRAFRLIQKSKGKVDPLVNWDRIENHFLTRLGELHGFPPSASKGTIKGHWGRALNEAYDLVADAERVLLHRSMAPGQATELYNRSYGVKPIIEDMAYSSDPVYQFEARRQAGLALIIGDFISFPDDEELRQRGEEIGKKFRRDLFAYDGTRHDWRMYGSFDSSTNEFVALSPDPKPYNPYCDVKELTGKARLIEGIGSVSYEPDVKSPQSSAIKALIESAEQDGFIGTKRHIQDPVRATITLLEGGEEEARLVMAQARYIIEKSYKDVRVEEKNKVKRHRGQSEFMNTQLFQVRSLFRFPDMPGFPFELVVRPLKDTLNATYRNGSINPHTGLHVGPGHPHYELERLGKPAVFDTLYPGEVFGIDKRVAMAARSREIAEELRNRDAVSFGQRRHAGEFDVDSFIQTENPKNPDGRLNDYQVLDVDTKGIMTLKRRDGTTFRVSPNTAIASGMIGDERIMGVVKPLLRVSVV